MKPIVFCDFDGTITMQETFVVMIKEFTPELANKLLPEMYALRLTLREGVRQLMHSIPSKSYPEILEFMRHQQIRPGFIELLDFLDNEGIPLVVVSGGLLGMVKTILGNLEKRIYAIHAFDVDTSGEYLQVRSNFEYGSELIAKIKVMELYPTPRPIAIGDSLTDLNMAMAAKIVFARDRLAKYLDDRQKPYIMWQDFFDIKEKLAVKLKELEEI